MKRPSRVSSRVGKTQEEEPGLERRMQSTRRMQKTRAVERNEARRSANIRLIRTVILGAIATVAAFYWLGRQYGIDPDVMKEYIITTLLFVGVLAGLGLLGAGLLLLIKKITRGRGRSDPL